MKNLRLLFLILFLLTSFVFNLSAQTEKSVTIGGILNKSNSAKTYSIGEYKIQLPNDKKDSYNFYFDPYVGQEIKFRGNPIGEKTLEGDDIWYDRNAEPTKADYPEIIQSGKKIEDFIPSDWIILQEATGDLNNDGQEDAVLAIRGNSLKFFRFSYDVRGRIQFLKNPISGVTAFGTDGNPRILLVLLKEKDGYKLLTQNNSFLPISRFGIGEALDKIEILNGELSVHFSYGDPHWGFIEKDFLFRFADSGLNLFKNKIVKNLRNEQSKMLEYNFPEKKVKVTTLAQQDDEKEVIKKEEFKKLNFSNTLDLKTLTDFDTVEKVVAIEN